jgi:hypothetical protein
MQVQKRRLLREVRLEFRLFQRLGYYEPIHGHDIQMMSSYYALTPYKKV